MTSLSAGISWPAAGKIDISIAEARIVAKYLCNFNRFIGMPTRLVVDGLYGAVSSRVAVHADTCAIESVIYKSPAAKSLMSDNIIAMSAGYTVFLRAFEEKDIS